MRSFKILLVIAIAFTSILSSCKDDKDVDVIAPAIKTVTINNKVKDIKLEPGTQATVVVAATDNIKLGQIKLDIHHAFDGHGHNKTAWEYTKVINVSGTSVTEQEVIDVPEDAAGGPYHLTVTVIDAVGNIGKSVERLFTITGVGVPSINVIEPDFVHGFTIAAGDSINLRGSVADDVDLEYVEVIVTPHGSGAAAIYSEIFLLPGMDDREFNFSELSAQGKTIVIPVGTAPGEYEMIIKVKDSEGNYAFAGTEFDVIE